ncbi:MAG: ABC transporter permease [Acidimicrobiia bacterium]|jgi:putative ABC transport system permease protein
MNLGLVELRRTPGRFAAVAGAVGFIVFLALILAALSDGLYLGSTGAYRSSSAEIFVFSEGSGFELSGSTVTEEMADEVAEAPGVGSVGRLSSFNTTATSEGADLQLTLLGADEATMPSVLVDGRLPETGQREVVIDQQTQRRGLEIGSVISVNDGPQLEVVGIAEDAGFGFTTAWTGHDVFQEVRAEVRPELAGLEGTSQALGVSTSGEGAVDAVAALPGVEVATVQEAIDALPAASQQKSTLDAIVYTTFTVAAIVVGLFFALITLEKRSEYAVLKAIGMSNLTLVWALFSQAIVASLAGFVVGFGLSRLAGVLIPSDVPALFLTITAVTLLGITLVMGALGAIFSFRRVVKIDPANALGGAA